MTIEEAALVTIFVMFILWWFGAKFGEIDKRINKLEDDEWNRRLREARDRKSNELK
jgi:hypothetical protein